MAEFSAHENVTERVSKYIIPVILQSQWKWILNKRWRGFKYLGALITENYEVGKEVKHRHNLGNACYYSVQELLSSRIPSRNIKLKI